ncbi:MAG: serine hydrolase [Planctomycetota bacterium]|nr:serine hydrolase [Planctomycetota bacterium]
MNELNHTTGTPDDVTSSTGNCPDQMLLDGIVALTREHLADHPRLGIIPGACVAIGVGSLPIASIATGKVRRGSDEPVTESSIFRACSMTKAITAATCLRLVDRGLVLLDAPVIGIIGADVLSTALCNGFDPRGITLRRILSHTAGFNVHSYDYLDDSTRLPSARQLITGCMGPWSVLTLTHEPGSRWEYSGGGYTLLRLLIERLTGRDAAAVINEEVLVPGFMTSSFFRVDGALRQRLVSGHDAQGIPCTYRELPDVTSGGLFTTAADLARFWLACMPGTTWIGQSPPLLSAALADEMTRDQRPDASGRSWGLGFQLDTYGGAPIYRHAGCRPGWWGHSEGHPAAGVAFITLCNGQQGDSLFDVLIGKVRRFVHQSKSAVQP